MFTTVVTYVILVLREANRKLHLLNSKKYFEMMLELWSENRTENLAMMKVWMSKVIDEKENV